MLNISMPVLFLTIALAVVLALVVAGAAVALARWDNRSAAGSIIMGSVAFAGTLTLAIMLLGLMLGAGT
ncbi:hypothetical protein OG264_14950 [Streptomyces xanthophaeus]|uniref:hypothetical protein n=1 Tax=Streptomyces xanthophaeus TaxID=67385 RepID=UPI00386C3994|nr:hypothetical protein OG264_14950 [Streptomyces xanthophaeus]WST62347.1 hypothetical protein OG605_23485 [Streptomyces xanthophaeus]